MKKITLLFISTLLFFNFSYAEPWGKDADLAAQVNRHHLSIKIIQPKTEQKSPSPFLKLGLKAIQFHQEIISPADGPRSHFLPSSSQYTLEAMKRYGFFRGFILGCDRLMRENDDEWAYKKKRNSVGQLMKWNPVPQNLNW